MINADRGHKLEDSTKVASAGLVTVAGRPLALNSSGELIAAVASSKVYGLSKNDKNAFVDQSFGEFGAAGSGKVGAIMGRTIVTVSPSEYSTVDGVSTLNVYDPNRVYAPNDDLFANNQGLITNDSAVANGTTSVDSSNFLGRVSIPPTPTDTRMEIDLML
jgi:hypothetical protein